MNMYNDFVDELANYEFQRIFYGKFESSKLKFYSDSFQHCLKEVVEKRKPLLFFLYNDEVEKSKRYCELLSDPRVEDLICEKFIIMGWKINSAEEYCKNLADKVLIVPDVLDYLKRAGSAIFFIVPNMLSVKVQKVIDIDIDSADGPDNNSDTDIATLVSAVNVVDQLLASYNYGSFKNMTSAKYQQWMYDELTDRDYDSFEHDEHHLLLEKIRFAVHGPPKQQGNGTIDYEPKQIEESEHIFHKIQAKSNEFSKWKDRIVIAFIYNCIEPLAAEKEKRKKEDSKGDIFTPLPIFVLRKCKRSKEHKEANKQKNKKQSKNNNKNCDLPCRIFIDHTGRVYDSWDNYLAKNKLPPCKMIYPKNGKYQSNENSSEVLLEERFSPSCGFSTMVLQAADIGSGVTGIMSGAALCASMLTPAAIVTVPFAVGAGIAVGVYGVSRSSYTLYDRGQHEESIGFTDSESRAAYINIAAGAMSVLGAGAAKIVSSFVRSGSNVGASVQHTLTAINSANVLISGTATVNSCYNVLQQYFEEGVAPSTLTIVQLGSSLFFFGNSVYNFQTGRTMVQEMQTSTINEISEGLRSNRHRKTFNKMVKETTRVKGEVTGKAEVIAAMRKSASRDEMLAVLTRSNKYFNKEGIRFSAERGGISLNGVQVDILEYGNMPRTQQGFLLETLPPIPESLSSSYIDNNTRTNIQSMRYGERLNNLLGLGSLDLASATSVLQCFPQDVQPKILRICEDFTNQIDLDIIASLCDLLKGDVRVKLMRYVSDFIRRCVDQLKNIFEIRLLNEEVTAVCSEFGFKNPHVTIYNFIERIIEQFINGEMMKQLLIDFGEWYLMLTYDNAKKLERKEKRNKHDPKEKVKITCTICDGYYYKKLECA